MTVDGAALWVGIGSVVVVNLIILLYSVIMQNTINSRVDIQNQRADVLIEKLN